MSQLSCLMLHLMHQRLGCWGRVPQMTMEKSLLAAMRLAAASWQLGAQLLRLGGQLLQLGGQLPLQDQTARPAQSPRPTSWGKPASNAWLTFH